MKSKDKLILQKILLYINEIQEFIKGYSREDFNTERKTINACVFNLSQIGELVGKLSEDTVTQYDKVEWRGLRGLRNRIVHDYEGINLDMVWRFFENRIGRLRELNKRNYKIKETILNCFFLFVFSCCILVL